MSEERAYAPGLAAALAAGEVCLAGEEAHHLGRVRRTRAGARVLVFDGAGLERWAEVVAVGRREVTLRLLEGPTPGREPAVGVVLAVAPPKPPRMRWLVEKATELGARAIVPLVTERGVTDPSVRPGNKQERWSRITVEAAKQCGAARLPEVRAPASLEHVLATPADLRVLLDPGAERSLGDVLAAARPASLLLLIGPEGGFTEAEGARARAAAVLPARLGATILRVETAALAALAAVRAVLG